MKEITLNDLKTLKNMEGLILQGCGGDLQEWVDGINQLLTDEQILKNGSKFTDVSVFTQNGGTNLLFNMTNVELNIGKLAIWRIATHENFGATWLSDYRVNQMKMHEEELASDYNDEWEER